VELNYCIECAAELTRKDETEYVCANGHPYWNEPRASTCVVFLDGDRVLVARRGTEPRKGSYIFPGGFLHFGEAPVDAARREVREETGLRCGELALLDVYNIPYRENEASLSIVFLAREWAGEPEAGDDAAALTWQPIDIIESDRFAWRFPGLTARLAAR
jgi:8-oxo-dGTP diphosphatase